MIQFNGICPALVTPLDAAGKFIPASFQHLVERSYRAGAHGVYVCGAAGEGLAQPVEQRKLVAETAIQCSPPGKKVIVHVGARKTSEAVELARHAAAIGAQAIASLPPLDSDSFAEVKSYYLTLASRSDLPLYVYFYPELCPILSTTDQVLELCSIPNIIGVKFTDYNLFGLSAVRQNGYQVFNGRDEVLAAGLLMGASGGIGATYSLFPEVYVHIYDLARSGQWERARALQEWATPILQFLFRFPLIQAIKLLLTASGIECGSCIEPKRRLTSDERSALLTRFSSFETDGVFGWHSGDGASQGSGMQPVNGGGSCAQRIAPE